MKTEKSYQLLCLSCGYDLRAIESARCPECGADVDRASLGQSVIPWLHRRAIGRYFSFRKTVRLASFQPRDLARQMNCLAQFADAVAFRRLVVLHAVIPLGVLVTGGYIYLLDVSPARFWAPADRVGSVIQWLMIPVFWLSLTMLFFAATGVASYFFHPKSLPIVQQNRAVAISYYACAPLAYTPLTLLIFAVGMVGGSVLFNFYNRGNAIVGLCYILAILPAGLQFAALIRLPLVLLKNTTHCSALRRWTVGILLPFFWLIGAAIILAALPLAAWTIGVMIVTLLRG